MNLAMVIGESRWNIFEELLDRAIRAYNRRFPAGEIPQKRDSEIVISNNEVTVSLVNRGRILAHYDYNIRSDRLRYIEL